MSLGSPRTVFRDVHKVLPEANLTVVRPAILRLPIFDYAAAACTHWLEIRKQVAQFRPNVVVGFGIVNAFAGLRICRSRGIPFVYYLIDELHRLVPEPGLQGIARFLEKFNARNASIVVSINEGLREYSLEMGTPREQTRIIRAGVDLARFDPKARNHELRGMLGIEQGDIVLLFMGWAYRFSGLKEVAEALLQRPDGGMSIKLLAVGKGEVWDELEALRARSRHPERIVLVGWRPYSEVPAYLAAADVCLLPSQTHAVMANIVPIKVYEYMASGKPVIATRLDGLTKEFGDDQGIVYVEGPGDVVPTAERLVVTGLLPSLASAARRFVSANDWGRVTDDFEALLVGLAKDPRK